MPTGDKIISALPDWSGRIWFASVQGRVGFVEEASGKVEHMELGEQISNSFAIDDSGGVYMVTDKALYRFDGLSTTWREEYDNIGAQKPGQSSAGSGTTPTVMGTDYVAITDNADPMNVLVYKRAATVAGARLVCKQPVFEKGASNTDQSLIATGSSLVVENNYGYTGPATTSGGRTTTPGIERVDLDAGGGCHKAWHSDEIAPSAVPKLGAGSGLVYTYTKDKLPDPNADAVVLHRDRLPQRQDRVQATRGRGARLQQQLRADHDRPGRQAHVHRRARRRGDGGGRRHPGPERHAAGDTTQAGAAGAPAARLSAGAARAARAPGALLRGAPTGGPRRQLPLARQGAEALQAPRAARAGDDARRPPRDAAPTGALAQAFVQLKGRSPFRGMTRAMAVRVARRRLVVALVLYGAAVGAITSNLWPLVPFPEPQPLGAIAGVSFLFGFAMRRRAVLLPVVLFPLGWALSGSGWFDGIVVLAGAGPVAVTGIAFGALGRRGWIRLAARRARRREARAAAGGRRRFAPRLRRRAVAVP